METLAARLERLRREAGLTLSDAQRVTGYSRTAIRLVEDGARRPSAAYLARYAEVFGDLHLLEYCSRLGKSRGPSVYGSTGAELRARFGFRAPVVPLPRVEVAYKSALPYKTGPALMQALVGQSHSLNRWKAIKLLARELNGIEQLAVLHLLDTGADTEAVCPHRLGFRLPVVEHPHIPWLCLAVSTDDAMVAFFPQLGIESRRGCVRYVDFLAAVAWGRRRIFIDVELDGPTHDLQQDHRRQADLTLDTLRYPLSAVDKPAFGQRLVQDCLAHLE